MKNIILSGANGRMGKTIAEIVSQRDDIEILFGIDSSGSELGIFPVYQNFDSIPENIDLEKISCIIDFSNPSLLTPLTKFAVKNAIPVVAATTGYSDDQIIHIKSTAEIIPFFFTANMSLGINLLAEICKKVVAVLGEEYDIEIIEKHHNQKIDAPSGTALLLANEINAEANNQYDYIYDRTLLREKRKKSEIGIHAVRGGTIVGEHDVIFAGDDEVITLSHSASSRKVFANGAVRAAEFMIGKPVGLYSMKDLMKTD